MKHTPFNTLSVGWLVAFLITLALSIGLAGCGGGGSDTPPANTTINGRVTKATNGDNIGGVTVQAFATARSRATDTLLATGTTAADGSFSLKYYSASDTYVRLVVIPPTGSGYAQFELSMTVSAGATIADLALRAIPTAQANQIGTVTVTPTPAAMVIGAAQTFTAVIKDTAGQVIALTPSWTVESDGTQAIGVIDGAGTLTALVAGSGKVYAVCGGKIGEAAVTVTVSPSAPTIADFTPKTGPVGTVVTLTGTHLSGATVTFNGTAASAVTDNTATSLKATVPAGATTGKISVTTAGGTAQSTTDFTVTVPDPTITDFTPKTGPVGTVVTITGTHLSGATVTFNSTAASSVTENTATSLKATVPTGATTGKISVTTAGGTAQSATNFTVTVPAPTITDFTPKTGPVGTVVTITGTNLTGATAVKFNGTAATTVTDNSALSLKATVPTGATTGRITVTTTGGTATSAADYSVGGFNLAAYMPYTIGDTRTLIGTAVWVGDVYTETPLSQVTVNGSPAIKVEERWGSNSEYQYVWVDANHFLLYEYDSNSSKAIASPPMTVPIVMALGQSATSTGNWIVNSVNQGAYSAQWTVQSHGTITVPAGTFSDTILLVTTLQIPGFGGVQTDQKWFANGIGLIKVQYHDGSIYELTHAVVGGHTY